ncbi:hypothetical protein ACFVUY_38865 [Kitasatospora sp. NPDC058063]|uniref:hypothetical protein n=1 Tax=unclassified Kitasatospora TaxID=2633591 RepID=UPI0036D8E5C4
MIDNGWHGGRIGLPQPGAIEALRTIAQRRAVFVVTEAEDLAARSCRLDDPSPGQARVVW